MAKKPTGKNRSQAVQRHGSPNIQRSSESEAEPQILGEEVTEEIVAEIHASLQRYSGPLPHPELLAQYRAIDPKAGDWIFASATKEQDNRHWCDREPLRRAARAQWFAFIIAVLVILVGGLLIYFDKSAEGLATILVPLASILGIFIYREARALKEQKQSTGSDKTAT